MLDGKTMVTGSITLPAHSPTEVADGLEFCARVAVLASEEPIFFLWEALMSDSNLVVGGW